jgi:hypothetical protein
LNNVQRLGTISVLHSFRLRAGILSGPVALDVSKLDKEADTSSTVSSISEISISDLMGDEGKLYTALGEVKTEQKYALKSSAFSATNNNISATRIANLNKQSLHKININNF